MTIGQIMCVDLGIRAANFDLFQKQFSCAIVHVSGVTFRLLLDTVTGCLMTDSLLHSNSDALNSPSPDTRPFLNLIPAWLTPFEVPPELVHGNSTMPNNCTSENCWHNTAKEDMT